LRRLLCFDIKQVEQIYHGVNIEIELENSETLKVTKVKVVDEITIFEISYINQLAKS